MTLKDFYAAAGGNYTAALEGLGKEERILKYVRKFGQTEISAKIRAALDAGDYETAFREAHNLKGMSLNIALTSLAASGSELTESLRNGPTGDVEGLYAVVAAEYDKICALIKDLDE